MPTLPSRARTSVSVLSPSRASAGASSKSSRPNARAAGRSARSTSSAARMVPRDLNRRAVESLIKAGAFDSLGFKRRALLTASGPIIDSVTRRQPQKHCRTARPFRHGRRRLRKRERPHHPAAGRAGIHPAGAYDDGARNDRALSHRSPDGRLPRPGARRRRGRHRRDFERLRRGEPPALPRRAGGFDRGRRGELQNAHDAQQHPYELYPARGRHRLDGASGVPARARFRAGAMCRTPRPCSCAERSPCATRRSRRSW